MRAERQAHEEARRQQYQVLWTQAKETLQADVEAKNLARLATLLALPVCQAAFCRYVDGEQWHSLAQNVGTQIGMFMPWNDLLIKTIEKQDQHTDPKVGHRRCVLV